MSVPLMSLYNDAKMKDILNFVAQAKSVVQLEDHRNVVAVLGISLDNVPYFICNEYLSGGNLKDFLLRNLRTPGDPEVDSQSTQDDDPSRLLITVTSQVCDGMSFLAKHKFRHPALSAKKVLLTGDGMCKLYDFWPEELALDRVKKIFEKSTPPMAWLSPEVIFLQRYTEKSDVWSFGVLIWEIYSHGDIPFRGLTCSEIELRLRNKEHLKQPLQCPGGIYGIMLSSWINEWEERPTFQGLAETLSSIAGSLHVANNYTKDNASELVFYNTLEDDAGDYIEP